MKHTYLYPLEDGEQWLWRAGRMGGDDLFGSPDMEAPGEEWVLNVRVGEVLGQVRDQLMERLESRDRICIGRHYVIPGSLCEAAQSRGQDADRTVRYVTQELWDAPYFHGITWVNAIGALQKVAGRDGRDTWSEIQAFFQDHKVTKDNGKRIRVVPVWM